MNTQRLRELAQEIESDIALGMSPGIRATSEFIALALEAATLLEQQAQRPSAPAVEPLVMPPNEYGTVVIWPLGKVGDGFEASIEVYRETQDANKREWLPVPSIAWGVGGSRLIDIEFTRAWARGMLLACEIAEQMQQRPQADA